MLPPATGLGRKIFTLLAPWRGLLGIVFVCIVIAAIAELVPPFVVRFVVNQDLVPRRTTGLIFAAAIYLGAITAQSAFTFAYSYLGARVSQSAIATLRVRLFERAMSLPVSYFDHNETGDLISRSTADVETVDELFTDGIATLVGQLVPLVATVAAMIVLSPLLSAVAAVVLPPLLLALRYLQVRVRNAQRSTRLAVSRLNVELAEVVGGVETLRAFGSEETFVSRFRGALRRTLLAQRDSTKYNAFFAPVSSLLSAVVIAALLWVGAGHSLAAAGVSLGTLTAFILLFQNFFAPIVALGDEWQSVQAAIAGAERVFQVLDLEPEHPPEVQRRPTSESGIEVEGVGFSYRSGRSVLKDVSLSVRPGEHVAVVGRTGAGKSTLVSVIGGLYAPDSGKVTVAGADPRALSEIERRQVIGVVPQLVQLFGGTLRENLTLFDPGVAEDAIWRALDVAGVSSLARSLPDGLDTPMAGGGRGAGSVLSAGQRQLVALARAMVPDPQVLLLDEATAAIDGVSDQTFRSALRDASRHGGRAVLTVAHRISTAREADRVVVMEEGSIVEEGSPDDLLGRGGRFAAFADLEAAGWGWQEVTPEDYAREAN